MKIAPKQINAFLAKPPENILAALFHGNDNGLMSERARQLACLYNENLDDVFSVSRISGDMLSGEPGLIADTAAAIPALGNRRLVLVKGRGSELLEGCKQALSLNIPETMIIVEATDTTSAHAIVKLFNDSQIAASIGCYADSAGDIRVLATSIFNAEKIKVSPEALNLIISRLGSDHATSRREIEKLALMAGPGGHLSLEDAQNALGDSALLAIDDIADALANGMVSKLQKALNKAWLDDATAVMVLRGCQTYFRHLSLAGHNVATGQSPQHALRSLRPPVHFKVQDRLKAQLRRWPPQLAMSVVNRLQDIELLVKSGRVDERVLTAQSLLGVCLRTPR
jgi:DNA polymerase-3 subunit delta